MNKIFRIVLSILLSCPNLGFFSATAADRYGFNVIDFAQELKMHVNVLTGARGLVNPIKPGECSPVVVGGVYIGKHRGS
jgi:hypothetical protein